MSRRVRVLAAVAPAAIVAVTGCGGSSKQTAGSSTVESTGPRTSVSAQQLIAKTDGACRAIHAKFASYRVTTPASLAQVAPGVSAYEVQVVGELKKLAPPESLKSDWETIVQGLNTLAVDTARVAAYAAQNNLVGARPLIKQTNDARLSILKVARRGQFAGCAIIVR